MGIHTLDTLMESTAIKYLISLRDLDNVVVVVDLNFIHILYYQPAHIKCYQLHTVFN